eukprot:evm.model.NODE_27784_length_6604_cov_16.906118.1
MPGEKTSFEAWDPTMRTCGSTSVRPELVGVLADEVEEVEKEEGAAAVRAPDWRR